MGEVDDAKVAASPGSSDCDARNSPSASVLARREQYILDFIFFDPMSVDVWLAGVRINEEAHIDSKRSYPTGQIEFSARI